MPQIGIDLPNTGIFVTVVDNRAQIL
jgi:hypothetical protein